MVDLKCRRCKADLPDLVQHGNRGAFIACVSCGLQVRVISVARAPQPRQRPRMSKKARRRERRKLAEGLRTIPSHEAIAAAIEEAAE